MLVGLGEIRGHASERAFQDLFVLFFKFCCSSCRDRDNADNMKPGHIIWKFGNILSLVTCGDLKVDLSKNSVIASQCFFVTFLTLFPFFLLYVAQDSS